VEKPGTFQSITFQPEEVAFLHILIHSGDNVLFEGRKKILVRPQKNVIRVETDKGVYKPGETVRFRIVNFDEDFKVIKNEYSHIWLEDSEHNRIAEWLNVKPNQGIVDLSFPLASEASLGMYTISVQQGMARKKFRVEEYVPKKFEITFEYPAFVTGADEEFQLKICGKYTYGKPVEGEIEVHLQTSYEILEGKISDHETTNQHSLVVKTEPLELNEYSRLIFVTGKVVENGTGSGEYVECCLPCSQLLWFWPFCFSSLHSGAHSVDMAEIPVEMATKSIEFINIHPFYKRGLPYTGKPLKIFCISPHLPLTPLKTSVNSNNSSEKISPFFTVAHVGGIQVPFHHLIIIANSCFGAWKATYLKTDDEQDSSESHQEAEGDLHWLKPFYSESNSFLEIKAKDDVMPCDQDQEVQVEITKSHLLIPLHVFRLFLAVSCADLQGSFSLPLTTGNDFLPHISLLVYTIFSDGEVVADVEHFGLEKCFRHKVALEFSQKEEVPGTKVELNLKAAPGSLCSVRAVDKTVLLKGNDTLTAESSFNIPCSFLFIIDLLSLLFPQILRMKIVTNARIKKPVSCVRPDFEKKMNRIENHVVDNIAARADLEPHSDDKKKPKPRTLFPEVWIWDLVSVGGNGQASLQVDVPDTITEWNADTFCVADTGFGFSPLATLRVFQPFFVDLSLPYSVVQGETFSLKATVFNYLKDCIQIHTTLTETPELKVDACPNCQFTSCLCANEAKTFVWNVTATRLEDSHNLCGNVIAVTSLQGERDTVIKPLLVKPGGVPQEETQNAFLCSSDNTVSEEFSLTLPAEVLEGSVRATFSVIGDIMGPALQNLDRLLGMPFGCGEQNMVKFAPNIFILQYLNKTKQLDAEIKEKALKFLTTGYQRELLFRHDDGSYSAFGKGDDQGNTWLTAFVARSFGQASSYIYIDKDHVHSALLWLQKHQLSSGCFQSVGKLFNNDLKGGVDDTISLTAYVAAALLELHLEKNDTMLDNALHCLKNVTLDETSLYVKALMAYVFTLSKDMEMREQLLDMIEKETVLIFHMFLPPSADFWAESSSMIETVAYIVLAHVSKPDFSLKEASVNKLVQWLSRQRNGFGGFASTQDTVVSLQALAQYAALIPQEIRDVKVTVKGKEASPLEFHVHRNNKFVLHQAPLLPAQGTYTVQATGSGCVYVQRCFLPHQTTLYYNTPPSPKTEEVFVLDVETIPRECDGVRKELDIHVSVSYVGDRGTSNMALVEVEMLSGFIPLQSSVKELEKVPLVKKSEIKPDKVTIYLEELGETALKLNISVEQDVEVQNLKAATVQVYDYYKPDERAAREYVFPCSS
ncbi:A2ML1 protein, partial [Sakesphorus luctuosus]|nr:A2ML1 protein [Sakesphorus luctuosus]